MLHFSTLDIDALPDTYPSTGKLQSKGGWAHPNLAHPLGETNDERIIHFEEQVREFAIHRRVRDAAILTFWPRAKKEDLDARWLGLLKEFGIPTVLRTIDEVIDNGSYGNPDELRPDFEPSEDDEDEQNEARQERLQNKLRDARTWEEKLRIEDGMNSRSELDPRRAKRLAKRADRRNTDRAKRAQARKADNAQQPRG